jgi:hypothetical protein
LADLLTVPHAVAALVLGVAGLVLERRTSRRGMLARRATLTARTPWRTR